MRNQVLFSINRRDFSFIVEEHLSDIFNRLSTIGVKINLMQNSALNFSILADRSKTDPQKVIELFTDDYEVRYNEGLELVTIRHYDAKTLEMLSEGKETLVEQRTRQTARLVLKEKTA